MLKHPNSGLLRARRHVHTGHFGQVLVSGGAGHLSPQVADWHDLKGDQEQYEDADEWSSGQVCSSEKDYCPPVEKSN